MDLIRACSWQQITNSPGFIPASFTAPYADAATTPYATTTTPFFQGTISISNAPVTESYAANLKQVTVTVSWMCAQTRRTRSMTTFVSPYGIQTYSQ